MIRSLFLDFSLAPAIALAGNCKVIDVGDGDTFTCFTDDNDEVKVRLAEIDAPEMNRPYGDRSKQSLHTNGGPRPEEAVHSQAKAKLR